MISKNSQKSFTIIEVLVVIAVIGLLMTIVLVSISSTRAKARDTKRMAEILALAKGLEAHYSGHGQYPTTTEWISLENGANSETQSFISEMKPDYLSAIPGDILYPQEYEPGNKYSYRYIATTTDSYKLYAKREKGGYIEISSEQPILTYDIVAMETVAQYVLIIKKAGGCACTDANQCYSGICSGNICSNP